MRRWPPRRQQAAWHLERSRHQGAWLRRSPQGDAARHRGPHGRPGHLRRSGRRLDSATLEDLGRACRVVSTKDDTTFIEGGRSGRDQGPHRADSTQIETTTSDFDREKLQERLAKLAEAWR